MRFVVRFRGQGATPKDDVAIVRAAPGARVLDEGARMLLVEAPSRSALSEIEQLPNWIVVPETSVPLPNTRASLRRG
jgi:hypothetical protein